jgi:hypothetical protein
MHIETASDFGRDYDSSDEKMKEERMQQRLFEYSLNALCLLEHDTFVEILGMFYTPS